MATLIAHSTNDKTGALIAPRKYANPFSEFRHEMDGLFDRFFASKPAYDFRFPELEKGGKNAKLNKDLIVPDIDIRETKNNIWLRAELPGLSAKNLDITFKDGVLTLKGEKKLKKGAGEENIRVLECCYGTFERSLTLPRGIDQDKIKATFEDGVLTIEIPKVAQAPGPEKRIHIL
jgi:HSP20 family protein